MSKHVVFLPLFFWKVRHWPPSSFARRLLGRTAVARTERGERALLHGDGGGDPAADGRHPHAGDSELRASRVAGPGSRAEPLGGCSVNDPEGEWLGVND